jgi:oligopeptide transport system permease protein
VALAASLVSLVLGVGWGALAGYAGGALDAAMMRAVDALYGLPYVFFVILLMTISRDPINLFIGLGAVQWLTMARVVRGQVLSLKGRDYVTAARAAGAGHAHILLRHILPGLAGTVAVYLSLQVPQAMRAEAFLSFLGLGVQAPDASWGSLAAEGLTALNPIQIDWWLLVFPGGALALALYSLGALGDALRDAIDPRKDQGNP